MDTICEGNGILSSWDILSALLVFLILDEADILLVTFWILAARNCILFTKRLQEMALE
jgi:hypothetical protein